MGYLRKLIALILSVVFLAALVIGIGVIFSVRNVNVSFMDYTGSRTEELEAAKSKLEKLKGSNLLFLSDEEVTEAVNGEYIAVEKVEKVFPCTVDIVIVERMEAFACANSNGYDIYDLNGGKMRSDKSALNKLDNCPNVMITGSAQDVEAAIKACAAFKNEFGMLRNVVESVEIQHAYVGSTDVVNFNLYSGLKIRIADFDTDTQAKIKSVKEQYDALSEAEKLRGTIMLVPIDGVQTATDAVYIP